MNNTMIKIVQAIYSLLLEMSPYLLFGFLVAGFLNLIIPKEKIYNHLSGNSLSSIIKASLFGVPLPLCSCGVIPVAAYLRKEGAGKGPTISFLSSTPTTGVDSILATYSLLGPLFAFIRPLAALLGGILSGTLTGIFDKNNDDNKITTNIGSSCAICNEIEPHKHSLVEKIQYIFRYGFFDLIEDAGKWIFIGIVVGGFISFAIPQNVVEMYLSNPLFSYPLMLVISIPMYICATGSIPIAASLILKGMSPGAGLIFLIAGPATNAATLTFVSGKLGKKSLFTYLFSIVITSLVFGIFIDYVWKMSGKDMSMITGNMKMVPLWLKQISTIILSMLMVRVAILKIYNKYKKNSVEDFEMQKNYVVSDMTCKHCVNTIEKTIQTIEGIEEVRISLDEKLVQIDGEFDEYKLMSAIQDAGYTINKKEK